MYSLYELVIFLLISFSKIKPAVNGIVCIDKPPLRKCARIHCIHSMLRRADNLAVFIQKYKEISGKGVPALVAAVLWQKTQW